MLKKSILAVLAIKLMIVSLIVLNSCKKESVNQITNQKSENLINPMEYVGVEHNKFMEKFTENLELSYKKKEWEEIEFLSDEYIEKFSDVMNESCKDLYYKSNSTVEFHKTVYNQIELNEWYDNDKRTGYDIAKNALRKMRQSKSSNQLIDSIISQKDQQFTNNLLSDLISVSNKEYTNSKEAFLAIEFVVKKHEKLILTQDWDSNEKTALGSLAIAKYSLLFWKDYDFSKFDTKTSEKSNTPKKNNNPKSGVVVAADVIGYAAGGVVGTTVGVGVGPVTLGAGTVAGVLVGKAVGAWAGSGMAATAIDIYNAWGDFFK